LIVLAFSSFSFSSRIWPKQSVWPPCFPRDVVQGRSVCAHLLSSSKRSRMVLCPFSFFSFLPLPRRSSFTDDLSPGFSSRKLSSFLFFFPLSENRLFKAVFSLTQAAGAFREVYFFSPSPLYRGDHDSILLFFFPFSLWHFNHFRGDLPPFFFFDNDELK